ncbi:MAG: hypothetical protein ABTQ34_08940 [Bdellovibrionales bacterium]
MERQSLAKPAQEDWFHWARVVLDRLTTCVHVYSHPPHEDVFMAERERLDKNAKTLSLLRRIHTLTDEAETPTGSLKEVADHDERVIAGLSVLLRETLSRLPSLSSDMQFLLKSPWFDRCNGRLASELFRGPMGNEPEGIGSGYPEHGRLPEALETLLEREDTGDYRQPRAALHRHGQDGSFDPADGPLRSDDDIHRRWTDKNSQYLRSAGRVD